jgi:hypothetical protein
MRHVIIYDPDNSMFLEYQKFLDKHVQRLINCYNIQFDWFNSTIELIIWVNNSPEIHIKDTIFVSNCKLEFAGYFNYSLFSFSTQKNGIPQFFSSIIDHILVSEKPFSEMFIAMIAVLYADIDDEIMTKMEKIDILNILLKKNFNKSLNNSIYSADNTVYGKIRYWSEL